VKFSREKPLHSELKDYHKGTGLILVHQSLNSIQYYVVCVLLLLLLQLLFVLERLCSLPSLLNSVYQDFLTGVKRPEREADHSPLPSAEIKNVWNIPSLPHTSSWLGA
jgi:hypothetical protein